MIRVFGFESKGTSENTGTSHAEYPFWVGQRNVPMSQQDSMNRVFGRVRFTHSRVRIALNVTISLHLQKSSQPRRIRWSSSVGEIPIVTSAVVLLRSTKNDGQSRPGSPLPLRCSTEVAAQRCSSIFNAIYLIQVLP